MVLAALVAQAGAAYGVGKMKKVLIETKTGLVINVIEIAKGSNWPIPKGCTLEDAIGSGGAGERIYDIYNRQVRPWPILPIFSSHNRGKQLTQFYVSPYVLAPQSSPP